MKSAYYTAVVTNAYRMALDAYLRDPEKYEFDARLLRELDSVSHREYCTGYYLGLPFDEAQLCSQDGYIREKAYFATAEGNDSAQYGESLYRFRQKNKVKLGDVAEVISPSKVGQEFTVTELFDLDGNPIESAPHPSQEFLCRVPFEVKDGDIMRSGGGEAPAGLSRSEG